MMTDRNRNEGISFKARVAPIEDTMKESHLKWFCYGNKCLEMHRYEKSDITKVGVKVG